MRTKILMYWPLAIVLLLAVAAWLHAAGNAAARAPQMPLAMTALTAELARTVSYGFVGEASDAVVKPMSMPASATLNAPAAL